MQKIAILWGISSTSPIETQQKCMEHLVGFRMHQSHLISVFFLTNLPTGTTELISCPVGDSPKHEWSTDFRGGIDFFRLPSNHTATGKATYHEGSW